MSGFFIERPCSTMRARRLRSFSERSYVFMASTVYQAAAALNCFVNTLSTRSASAVAGWSFRRHIAVETTPSRTTAQKCSPFDSVRSFTSVAEGP